PDGGTLNIDGSAEQVRTSTDWGATYLRGTFGTVESTTEVGALEGEALTIDDRIDAVTTTGTLELDFTNDAIPAGGIVAKTEEGPIELSLPNLDIAQENMAAEAKEGDGETEEVEDFFYRINAKSNDGSVDLASDLDEYDAAKNPQEAEGKKLVPVSATADTGMVTITRTCAVTAARVGWPSGPPVRRVRGRAPCRSPSTEPPEPSAAASYPSCASAGTRPSPHIAAAGSTP